MKYWIDEKTGTHMCEPNCCDEWLELIWMIGVDYDGCRTVKSLQELVDELVDASKKARNCLHDGLLFPQSCYNCKHGGVEDEEFGQALVGHCWKHNGEVDWEQPDKRMGCEEWEKAEEEIK